nr:DNA polymerase III subunit delta' [uncultured Mitsuokella sp.]
MERQWEDIIGHEEKKCALRTMLHEGRLPHALLFAGPDGIGKKMLGRVLAAALLCEADDGPCGRCDSCQAFARGAHPDYIEVVPEKNGKSAAQIRIEAIRAMQTQVSRYPVLSKRRVVLIDDADCMNEAAENSLLKTLEEPEGPVTFILVTSARSALLDTILSRCMLVSFGMLSVDEVREVLRQQDVPEDTAGELASLSDGSPGRALALLAHDGLQLRDEALAFLQVLPHLDMEKIWTKSAEMGERDREALREWFLYLNMLLRDLLVLSEDGASPLIYHQDIREKLLALLPVYPEYIVFSLLREVREAQKRLQSNASLRLLIEGFFIRTRDIMARVS